MKKNKIIFGIMCCMMALMSCAANRVVQYQSESASTSSIKVNMQSHQWATGIAYDPRLIVAPSTRLRNVVVTLDGNLVWEETRTVQSLTIENVPAGNHELRVTCASWIYKDEINHSKDIEVTGKGETKTELVSVPPFSVSFWLGIGIATLLVAVFPIY
jgi:hypothetical protein